jgi:hypothetical protein
MRDLRKETNGTERADLQKNRSSWTNQLAEYRNPAGDSKQDSSEQRKGPNACNRRAHNLLEQIHEKKLYRLRIRVIALLQPESIDAGYLRS